MPFAKHVIVSVVGNGENVRGHFGLSFSLIAAHHVIVVNWEPLVGVNRNAKEPRIRVDQEAHIP